MMPKKNFQKAIKESRIYGDYPGSSGGTGYCQT